MSSHLPLTTACLLGLSLAAAAPAGAQVPDAEVGFIAFFNRDYAVQFPGPESGEAEITHMDMAFTDAPGLRVNITHDRNIGLNDPGMPVPWRVTVLRGGQVLTETMTQTDPRSSPPLQQVDLPFYPQAGDVVQAVGPAGYRSRAITFDGLPSLDSCVTGSGSFTTTLPPGAPTPIRQLPDSIRHGRSDVPFSGSGKLVLPVAGGPSSSITVQTSREVAPLDYVTSRLKADPPYCGGLGPRDGQIAGGELDVRRDGVRFIGAIRCSAYSAVPCRVTIRATARRKGKRVAAVAPTRLLFKPGVATRGKNVPFKRWVRRALRSKRRKDPVVSASATVTRPAPIGTQEMAGADCAKPPGLRTCG